jgi:hypothetical protein
MGQPSPAKNAKETQETEKAPFLVVKRVREAILDEVFKPGDRVNLDLFHPLVKNAHAGRQRCELASAILPKRMNRVRSISPSTP